MKLLLDEMHAPAVAEALRSRGIDAIAVAERDDLRGLSDVDLLQVATVERRAVATENVKDFAVLHRHISAAGEKHSGLIYTHSPDSGSQYRGLTIGEKHSGLIYTHSRRFARSVPNHVRVLADALMEFANRHAPRLDGTESFAWWLESGAGNAGSAGRMCLWVRIVTAGLR